MPEHVRVSVVIPTWNGKSLLDDCLDSLVRQIDDATEVIVVDDGSTDGTAEHLARHRPDITIIRHDCNRGFAAAVNSGIRGASGEFVVLLNNDARPAANWLSNLVDAAESAPSDVGLVTSKIVRMADGRLDTTGDFLTVHGVPWSRGNGEVDTGQFDDEREVFGACAGATLYRRILFDDVGLFAESFFAYYEDVDLSARARRRGWRAMYAPSAVVEHRVHATSKSQSGFFRYQTTRNLWYLVIRTLPARLVLSALPSLLVLQTANVLGALRHGEVCSVVRAYRDVIRALPRLIHERRVLAAGSRITGGEFARMVVRVPLSEVAGWRPLRPDYAVFGFWFASRLLIFGIAAIAATLRWPGNSSTTGWTQWDAWAFVRLARWGYSGYEKHFHDGWVQTAFFPGEPVMLRVMHAGWGSWEVDGLVLAAVFGGAAMVLLARLVVFDGGLPAEGTWSAVVLMLSPYAVFLCAGYSEAPFLAVAVGSWLAARKRRWVLAGVLAGLAMTLRITGAFLVVGLAVEYAMAEGRLRRSASALLLPVFVLAGYTWYLHSLTGDWLAWVHAQANGWNRHVTFPWRAAMNSVHVMTSASTAVRIATAADAVALLVGVVVVAILMRRRRLGEASYMGLQAIAFATSTTYYSVARAALLWWPMWVLLGQTVARSRRVRAAYLAVALPALVGTTLAFTHGVWVD